MALAAPRRWLILGGSNFMGRALVQHLVTSDEHALIFLLNRGNIYWGADICDLSSHVQQLTCNRKDAAAFRALVAPLQSFDVVVDFSSVAKPDRLQIALDVLSCVQVGLFVYISSDSVYEVCEYEKPPGTFMKEEFATRPRDVRRRMKLAQADEYAEGKMRCEELLKKTARNSDLKYTCLRLPDVIGPCDNTPRFWLYQLWLSVSHDHPVSLGDGACSAPLSFVYSGDVATAVSAVATRPVAAVHGHAFNIACEEKPCLREFLNLIASALGIEPVYNHFHPTEEVVINGVMVTRCRDEDSEKCPSFFPSVDCGAIDISKAISLLEWHPTALADCIAKTVAFNRKAWHLFPHYRPDLGRRLKDAQIMEKLEAVHAHKNP